MGDFKMGSKTVLSQSGTNDPTWGANAPTNMPIQIAYNESSTVSDVTNTTAPGDVVLSHSITPKFDDSKILIQVQLCYSKENNYTGYARLYRGSTWVYPDTSDRGFPLRNQSEWGVDIGYIQYMDSPTIPSTPVAITYNVYCYTTSASKRMSINRNWSQSQDSYSGGSASSSILLTEVKQ